MSLIKIIKAKYNIYEDFERYKIIIKIIGGVTCYGWWGGKQNYKWDAWMEKMIGWNFGERDSMFGDLLVGMNDLAECEFIYIMGPRWFDALENHLSLWKSEEYFIFIFSLSIKILKSCEIF